MEQKTKTTEKINVQRRCEEIHAQYGTSEMANYRILLMCDKITKDAFNEGKQSVIDNIHDLVWLSGRAETIIGTIELTHCLNYYSFRIGEMRFWKNYDCLEDAMKAANDYYKNRIKKILGL
jgi:hypothetical protein